MRVSFKVSKKGTRFLPKSKPENPNLPQQDELIKSPHIIPKNSSAIVNPKPSVNFHIIFSFNFVFICNFFLLLIYGDTDMCIG